MDDRADPANGYEAASTEFMTLRTTSRIGVATVRRWADNLPPRAAVVDLGCGHGVPIARALVEDGFSVSGVDASPSMIAAFRARFPDAPAECSRAEDSRLFGRTFDAAIAWGLLFLLEPEAQGKVVRRVSRSLRPGGRFLFTSPAVACAWTDALTGRTSVSLGAAEYRRILEAEGLALLGEAEDEGDNHYYFARKRDTVRTALT